MTFRGYLEAPPDPATRLLGGKSLIAGRNFETEPLGPETQPVLSLTWEYIGLQMMFRSLVAPHKERPAD